jgi:hypothetical protein
MATTYGVSEAGFILKSYDVILAEMQEEARTLFGDDIDVSIYSPFGQFLEVNAKVAADLWEAAEDTYYNNFLDTATGTSLDRVCALRGIARLEAQLASGSCTVTADSIDVTLAVGDLRVQTVTSIVFTNTSAVTITSTGTSVTVVAEVAGPTGIVAAGSIVEFTSPIAGLDSVTNASPTTGGSDIETDPELRARYKLRTTTSGASVSAILSAILGTDGVYGAYVVENSSNAEDENGLPPHSIQILVDSDLAHNADIAQTIFNNKSAGIEPYCSSTGTTVNVTDENGDTHPMKWDVPTKVPINVLVTITSTGDSTWDDASKLAIRQRIVEVIGGTNILEGESTGTAYTGLGIGAEVRVWMLEAKMDDIEGVDEVIITIDKYPEASPDARKVTIEYYEFASCDADGSDTYGEANNIQIVVS